MNGRLILAGHDPQTMTLRSVLDATVAVLAEVYRSYGMDFWDAIKAAATVGIPEEEKPKAPVAEPVIDNDQAMNSLMGMMAGTGKKMGR